MEFGLGIQSVNPIIEEGCGIWVGNSKCQSNDRGRLKSLG